VSDRFDDLSQRVLEGNATSAEREQLAKMLAHDVVLKARHEELERAFDLLRAARLAEPPEGMPEAILRDIERADRTVRGRTLHALGRKIRPTWLRFALPAAAAMVAVALLWSARDQYRSGHSGNEVAGTMSPPAGLRLGDGARLTTVRAEAAPEGFDLALTTGSEPVHVTLHAGDPAVLLATSRAALGAGGPTWEAELPGRSSVLVHGVAPGPTVTVQVQVRFRDGRTSSGELRITSPRPLSPNGVPRPEPTSRPAGGH